MTATQERAGGFSANTLEYSALTNGKSAHVGNEHGGFDHVFDARPGCGEKGPDVLQALFRLGRDTFGEFARGGIDAELSGAVQGLAERTAWEKGPMAAGASAVERMVFIVFSFGFL